MSQDKQHIDKAARATVFVSSNDDDEARRKSLRRLLRANFVANSLLFLGGAFFVVFAAREIITFCRRDPAADVIYSLVFIFFFASGLTQMIIDVFWTRTVAVGRYSTNRTFNLLITSLFLSGTICDLVGFTFWRQGIDGVPAERRCQWVGHHFWLLSSIIVVFSNYRRFEDLEDKLDAIGNFCFFMEAVLNVCARYFTDIYPEDGDALDWTEVRLELAAAVFWTLNSFFYLLADVSRLREMWKRDEQKQQKGAIKEVPIALEEGELVVEAKSPVPLKVEPVQVEGKTSPDVTSLEDFDEPVTQVYDL